MRRLIRLASVGIAPVPDDGPAARLCLRAYAAELATRFPEGYDDSALIRPGETGVFLVAQEDDRPIGCVAHRRLAGHVAEVRHLWVGADARGLGLGRRLLATLEADAAGRGVTTMRLGTHRTLTEAIALYRGSGYHEIPRYDESPYNQVAFEKAL